MKSKEENPQNTQPNVQKYRWQKFHLLFSASFLVSFRPLDHLPQPWKLSSAFRLQLNLLMLLLTMLHPYWLLLLISTECMGRDEIRLFSFITLVALCDPSVNKLSFYLLNNSLYYLSYKRLHHLVAKENLHINKRMQQQSLSHVE